MFRKEYAASGSRQLAVASRFLGDWMATAKALPMASHIPDEKKAKSGLPVQPEIKV